MERLTKILTLEPKSPGRHFGRFALKALSSFNTIFPYITVVKYFILYIDLNFSSNMKLNDLDGYNPRVLTLQNKWRTVWRMSIDRKKALQDALDTLQEVRMYCLFIPVQMPLPEFILWNTLNIFSIFQLEGLKTFDFEVWKTKYLNWIKAKKLRITDFFRRQDKDGDGFLSREEFVNGMLHTRKCQKIDGKTRTRLHLTCDACKF